jgi:hypothetical protein
MAQNLHDVYSVQTLSSLQQLLFAREANEIRFLLSVPSSVKMKVWCGNIFPPRNWQRGARNWEVLAKEGQKLRGGLVKHA